MFESATETRVLPRCPVAWEHLSAVELEAYFREATRLASKGPDVKTGAYPSARATVSTV
jgi:hypothetical protein